MQELFGGSSSSSSGSSQSGFALLPQELQSAWKNYGRNIDTLMGDGSAIAKMFTPMGVTTGEQTALDNITRGFTPTADQLRSDIALQTNPFNDLVIGEINRQFQAPYSALSRQMSAAGQFGSNRGMLAANDIDLSRVGAIGQFQQGQFDRALSNALSLFPNSRRADAEGAMGAGGFLRGLDMQTRTAPVTAYQNIAKLIGILPTDGGSQSSQSSKSSSSNGMFGGGGGGMGNMLFSAGSLFSDARLKENVVRVGSQNGFNLYEFNYIGQPERMIGVMAQEVKMSRPDAVSEHEGFLAVNYDLIGITPRVVEAS